MSSLICDVGGSHLSSAAIIGHDGTVWVQSSTFPLFNPEKVTAILNDRTEPGSLAPTGLLPILGGTSTWLYSRRTRGCHKIEKGLWRNHHIEDKSLQGLVIGIYDEHEPMTPGQCNMIVERLGDLLN